MEEERKDTGSEVKEEEQENLNLTNQLIISSCRLSFIAICTHNVHYSIGSTTRLETDNENTLIID